MSPVRNQPSSSNASAMWPPHCASSPPNTCGPLARISPSPPVRIAVTASGRPTVPGFQAARAVEGEGRTRFGEAVALEDLDPRPVEEVGQPLTERAAAAERESQAPAEHGLQLPVHEAIERGVLGRRDRTVPSGHVVSDQRMATSSALSKIVPWPFGVRPCCWALLNTFSKTRGTATTIVGRTSASSSGRCADVGGECQLGAPLDATRAMILVSVWASGRNSRVTSSSGSSTTGGRRCSAARWCAGCGGCGMQPFGRPGGAGRVHDRGQPIGADAGDAGVQLGVVDVAAPGVRARRGRPRRSRTPRGRSASRRRPRRTSRASPASPTTARTASLSLRIHCTCSADDVS